MGIEQHTTDPGQKSRGFRVFILEDDEIRVAHLLSLLISCDVTRVASCRQAKKFVPPYDLILLDHDLGGRQITRHEDCGLTFVRMIKDKINPDATIVYHSYNPDGARAMQQEVGRGMIAPFGSSLFNQIVTGPHRQRPEAGWPPHLAVDTEDDLC